MSIRSTDTVVEPLESLPFLAGCPRKELALVDRHTTYVRVPAGTTLCSEGSTGQEAFIIANGEAEVTIGDVCMARLGAGSVVGEMALLDHGPRSATVTAATPMAGFAMSSRDFATILEHAPTLSRRLLKTLAGRLRDADARVSIPN